MTIGESIREIRKAKNIKQKDLAKKLNVTASMISQYENGIRKPKHDTLSKIAEALGCTMTELLPQGVYNDSTGIYFYFDEDESENKESNNITKLDQEAFINSIEWTDEELNEIYFFKLFLLSKRQQK